MPIYNRKKNKILSNFILTPNIKNAYKFTFNYIGEETWLAKHNDVEKKKGAPDGKESVLFPVITYCYGLL